MPQPRNIWWSWRIGSGVLLAAVLAALGIAYALEKIGVPPRLIAPYIERRTSGHNPTIVGAGQLVGGFLQMHDRGRVVVPLDRALVIGAQPEPVAHSAASNRISFQAVATTAQALTALAGANPYDTVTFAPGRYHFTGPYIQINRPGSLAGPIVVRAAQPGTVILEFEMGEGFLVSAPHWQFENLIIKGTCKFHRQCEHAFHIVGPAHHFVARNNTITDFNSHFKINAWGATAPDDGLIEGNTLNNTSVRQTDRPINVIDIVVASNWTIRKNLITDFFKGEGNRTSYGGFAKGGGRNNLFENNIVLCENRVHDPGAISVGLSLGGGGTSSEYCRDKRCATEQENSVIRGNLIASCSDEGIYLNKAAGSKVLHNTLIDTAGISVRFPASSADVEGNLVDGKIRVRDNAALRATDNTDTSITRLLVGSHPVRELFDIVDTRSFAKHIPRRLPNNPINTAPDLCGTAHDVTPAYGAFDRFSECLRKASSGVAVSSEPSFDWRRRRLIWCRLQC